MALPSSDWLCSLYQSKPRVRLECSGTCELLRDGPFGLGNQEAQKENAQTQAQEDAQEDPLAAPDEVASF
jgi:hypothetical protein